MADNSQAGFAWQVGVWDRMAEIYQQMAKPAHATTPSPHEVHNGPGILQDSIHVFCRGNVHFYFEFQVSIVGRADTMHGCDF